MLKIQGRRAVGALGAISVGAGAIVFRPGTVANRVARQQIERTARHLRDASGRLQGLGYRLSGRSPDPSVSDLVLTDRIRSTLGPLEKQLDIPHIHVMVEDHVALLHGIVAADADVDALERAVAAVSGVVAVESYLHVGLGAGDGRPSEGRSAQPPSEARRRLIEAATEAGVDPDRALSAVRAVLATFAERLPETERNHLAGHLPTDVRVLFVPPRRTSSHHRPRTAQELVATIADTSIEVPHERALRLTKSVLATLRQLVPEEVADVGAVLPPELSQLWRGADPPVPHKLPPQPNSD
jgi:uncharacterized protein (DUF2267 family)